MLVLLYAVLLLLVAPAVLLWLGRLIEANTDGRRRIAAEQRTTAISSESGGFNAAPWFRRPMQPVFGKPKSSS